jgi:hypothetical protein
MKTIIKILLMTFSASAFFGCNETIELDLEQTPPRIIVDGLITNENTAHYVKLSQSVDFYHKGKVPAVSGAEVTVSDNEGNVYHFLESETTAGYYAASFEGKIGNSYSLEVELPSGEKLSAEDQMVPVMQVDRLDWIVDEDEKENPREEGFYYRIRIFGEEPAATKDYYLFKFFRNDSIQNFDSKTGVFFADDNLVGGYLDGLESPEHYKKGDEGRFEIYRISRDAFLFYNDLNNILNGDGGMSSPSPTNPRSNIRSSEGPGLGLFQVSAVNKTSIKVGE